MNDEIFEEFAVLDAKIKELTNKKDELKTLIIANVVALGEKSVSTAVGKFTISEYRTWTYTDKVKDMEEKFKAQKAKEQSIGTATYEAKPSLRFTQNKL